MKVKTGSYTGTGATLTFDTGMGAQVHALLIKGGSANMVLVTTTMSSTPRALINGATVGTAALNSDGTVQLNNNVGINTNGTVYFYVALRDDGAGDFSVGSYTGDGGASKDITTTGINPVLAIVQGEGQAGVWKSSSISGTNSAFWTNVANAGTRITALGTAKFTVGNSTQTNTNLTVYHWLAFGSNSHLAVGTYTGNGSDNRDISTGLTDILAAFVKISTAGSPAEFRSAQFSDDSSAPVSAVAARSDNIQRFNAGGLLDVGTSAAVNTNTSTYFWIAFYDVALNLNVLLGDDDMNTFLKKRGATSQIVNVFVRNSSTGAGLTGLVFNTSGLTAYYTYEGDSASHVISLQSQTLGSWVTGGWVAVDATNQPGVYQLGIPNAALANGSFCTIVLRGAATMLDTVVVVILTVADLVDNGVNLNLSALPTANPGVSTGLPVVDTNLSLLANVKLRGTASAGAAQSITLTGGSSNDNYYRYDVVRIVSGLGSGQSRMIVNYKGSTLVASVVRPWVTAPDNTSVFVVESAAAPQFFSSGVATGGGASTLTLVGGDIVADHDFEGCVMDIVGGTGINQSRVITSSVFSTRVVTVDKAWDTTPDTTSIYEIWKFGHSWADVFEWNGSLVSTPSQAGVPITDPHYWNGSAVATPDTAGYPKTTVKTGTGTGEIALSGGNVPIQAGTGTGQLDFTSGVVKANLVQILGTALTETAGQIAAAFKKFFDIASPTSTANRITLVDTATVTTTATNLANAPTNGDFTAAMKTSLNAATPSVTVSDKTGFSLSAAGVQAIWDALTSALTTVGSIGKLLVTNIDATISSRTKPADTQARVTLVDTATVTTTAMNLTNAPTSGDFTAAMKASLNAATPSVTVSDKTGFSLSGAGIQAIWDALTANLTTAGSIGKRLVDFVTSLVYTTPLTSTQTAQAVLNAAAASYDSAGTIGEQINNAGSGGSSPTVQQIVDGVWDELSAAHLSAGTMGLLESLLAGINSRTQSAAINLNTSDTNVTLNITQTVTYSAANGNRKQVNVGPLPDPTGCIVTWAFVNGSTERTYAGTLISYDSGTGIAVVAMNDFTATKADFPVGAPTILAQQAFSVALVLPASAGNLVPIGLHHGKVNIEAAG